VLLTAPITATFSEPLLASTLVAANFTLTPSAGTVTVTASGNVVTIAHSAALVNNQSYAVNITTGVKDLAGNALASSYPWSFTTTNATANTGPTAINLGGAGNYAILAETMITNVDGTPTAITGDIALSPAYYAAVTGFALTLDGSTDFSTTTPHSLVSGKVYAADTASSTTPPILTAAVTDMTSAYTAAANTVSPAPVNAATGSGSIGGASFAPGVYAWTTNVDIASNITLTGSANDVFVFNITGNLATTGSPTITLVGVQAKNVFWRVSGSVSLGASTVFNGTILCATTIAVLTSTTVNGRLLAQAAVTLDTNTITP